MDRKMKKVIRLKIGEIFEKNCKGCENQYKHSNDECKDCPAFKELRQYGKLLIPNEPRQRVLAKEIITKDQLKSLLDQGYSKRAIERKYKLSNSAVQRLIDKFDLEKVCKIKKNASPKNLTKEMYINARNEGYTDKGFRDKYGISWKLCVSRLKDWGLEDFVPDWEKPPVLTPDVYNQLKNLGWKNNEIDSLYGLKRRDRERIVNPDKVIK